MRQDPSAITLFEDTADDEVPVLSRMLDAARRPPDARSAQPPGGTRAAENARAVSALRAPYAYD